MKNFLLITGVFAVMLIASCASTDTANSDTVKQSEICQLYTVTYDAGMHELSATAYFRFGGSTGTTLSLVKPSNIIFDGEDMAMENFGFTGTYYALNKQVDFRGAHEFKYTDNDNKTYVNKATVTPVQITEYPKTADKNTGFTVRWDNPLNNNEKISVYVEDSKNYSTYVSIDVVGATGVELSKEQIKDVEPGNINIYLVREMNLSLVESTHLGGNMFVKYTTEKIGMVLTGNSPQPESQQADK